MCVVSYRWDEKKNAQLRMTRGVSFEQVVLHIEQGDVLALYAHPNHERYPNQHLLVVRMGDYAYLVPYVESIDGIFLKTIIPSRKATRDFLGE
mgnify:CR=1 FL=1